MNFRSFYGVLAIFSLMACGDSLEEQVTEGLSTPTSIPDRPLVVDGTWLVETTGTVSMYNDLNGEDQVSFASWSLMTFRDGGQVYTEVCRLDLGVYDGGIMEIALDVPDKAVQPGVALSPQEANFDGGWAEDSYSAHLLILAGFEASGDAWTSDLPDEAEQTIDHDLDSKPGVTIPVHLIGKEGTIGEGENASYLVYVAHRLGQVLLPEQVTGEEMTGLVDVILDIAIVGSDNPLLAEQEIETYESPSGLPVFVAGSVSSSTSCSEILGD